MSCKTSGLILSSLAKQTQVGFVTNEKEDTMMISVKHIRNEFQLCISNEQSNLKGLSCKQMISPSHDFPSPLNPSLQVQVYDPCVSLQSAFVSHGLPSAHSSIS